MVHRIMGNTSFWCHAKRPRQQEVVIRVKWFVCIYVSSHTTFWPLFRRVAMMRNLLAPYEQRPWAQTNWILVRLWRVRSLSHYPFFSLSSLLPHYFFFSCLLGPDTSLISYIESLLGWFSQTSSLLPFSFLIPSSSIITHSSFLIPFFLIHSLSFPDPSSSSLLPFHLLYVRIVCLLF